MPFTCTVLTLLWETPPSTAPGVQIAIFLTGAPGELRGLSEQIGKPLRADVETEAREGKELVQGLAGNLCQRSRTRPSLLRESKGGRGKGEWGWVRGRQES